METATTYRAALDAGKAALTSGTMETARQHLEQALALASGDVEAADALSLLGRALGSLGRYDEAERALRDALRRAAGHPDALARAQQHMGTVRWMQGDVKLARGFLEDAGAGFKRLGMTRERVSALTNLGIVLYVEGEYQRAIDALRESTELAESIGDLRNVAVDFSNLGECYFDLGAAEEAQEYYRRALGFVELLDMPVLSIDMLRNLSRAQAQAGECAQALRSLERALALADQYQRKYLRLAVLTSAAEVRLVCGQAAEAEHLAQDVLAEVGDVPTQRAEARLVLGRCYLAQGDGTRALATLQEGLLDGQKGLYKMLLLRYHAALSQVVGHPAIAQVHRRIAHEFAEQIADSLADKALQATFRGSALFESVA